MNNQDRGNTKLTKSSRNMIYIIGGTAAWLTVIVALCELGINFLPGSTPAESAIDWLTQFENNWFMGLRNLGLLNIIMFTLGIPMYFALYQAHQKVNKLYAALAIIISFIGISVLFATNRAFSMLDLSHQYTHAVTDTQRSMILAAAQALLSVGKSHSPGTFIGFFLGDIAGILISLVMLRSKVFNKITAFAGITGFTLLLIYELTVPFIPGINSIVMIFGMCGGILNAIWLVMLGWKLFQLRYKEAE